jgi:Mechanosensitive ion channel, conserved TM helix
MAEVIVDTLRQAWSNYLDAIARLLPRVLATLSIVVAGWLLAVVLRLVTRRVLGWLKFNALAERIGAADLLKTVDLPPAATLAGSVVFWLVFIGFLLSGVDALGFSGVQGLMADFVRFVPRLVVAVVIVAVGFVAANFAWRATLLAAVNSRLPSARLVSNAVRFLILILAVAMALEHIAVAQTVVLTAFAIAFGAVMLGVAIALGIGGGGIARRILEQQFPERPKQDTTDGASHL